MTYHITYISVLFIFYGNLMILSDAQAPSKSSANDGDYNTLHRDGSYEFGYNNNDEGQSYHISQANRANVVRGRFGSRDPATRLIKETVYSAGPRGFRARGPNIHRKLDLDQRPRGPIGNKDDPYFDPNEDPSYSFGFKTPTYEKQEDANRLGDVTAFSYFELEKLKQWITQAKSGRYSYVDDVGERHNVEYIAGKNTGFHVRSAHPDSSPSIGPLYYNRPLVRAEKKQRGHTAIQRGLDGSYRFISAGPDQRRSESSDANGNVRGSYTFLDDKGVQRTVHYIAGPGIGYRILKNRREPYIPAFNPVAPSYHPEPDPGLDKPPPFIAPGGGGSGGGSSAGDDFLGGGNNKEDSFDDIFGGPGGSAASGHVKPPPTGGRPKPSTPDSQYDGDDKNDLFDDKDDLFDDNKKPPSGGRPTKKPATSIDSDFGSQGEGKPVIYGENSGGDGDDDIFGGSSTGGSGESSNRPGPPSSSDKDRPDTSSGGGTSVDDDDIFGSEGKPSAGERPFGGRPESSGSGGYGKPPKRPSRPGGSRPTRPGGRPSRPGGPGRPSGEGRPSDGGESGYGDGKPQDGSKPGLEESEDNDIFGEDSGDKKEEKPESGDKPSSGRPSRPEGGRPSGGGSTSNGRPSNGRPGYGNGRPTRPGGSNGRPSRPSRPGGNGGSSGGSGGRPGRPGTGTYTPDENTSVSTSGSTDNAHKKPGGDSFLDEGNDEDIFGPSSRPSSESTSDSGYPGSPNAKPDGGSDFDDKPGSIDISKPIDLPEYSTSRPRPGPRPDNGFHKPIKPIGPPPSSGGSSAGGGFLDNVEDEEGDGDLFSEEKNKGGPSKPVGGGPQISIFGEGSHGTAGGGSSTSGGGTQITISGDIDKYRGGTIFRNLGKESIHFPPGTSVRAHVQSIDLLPYGSKTKTPGEAVEEELKKHGSR